MTFPYADSLPYSIKTAGLQKEALLFILPFYPTHP